MTFNGFISYSHAADGQLAPAIHQALHRLGKPWHSRRALWIFRDQTGLAVTPALWSSIQEAIDSSEFFILLASPEAARSSWVNREVSHWLNTKSAESILTVVSSGTWTWDPKLNDFCPESDAVPPAMYGAFPEEPLFLDLRWLRDRDQLSLRHPRFRESIAQLAAPMHGVSKDELVGEDIRQHKRIRSLRSAAVMALLALTAAASIAGLLAAHRTSQARVALTEMHRQQEVAIEERGSADRSRREARRQQEVADRQRALARASAHETQRQEYLTRQQQAIADRAAGEAARQEDNALLQRRVAAKAAARARVQERIADAAALEARHQRSIARRQRQLADEAAANAERQQAKASQARRMAIGRRLMSQAQTAVDRDPRLALGLGLAAHAIQPGAEAKNELGSMITSTRYLGTLADAEQFAIGGKGVLATIDHSGTVTLWKIGDRGKPKVASVVTTGTTGNVLSLSPDGNTLAVAQPSSLSIQLWDIADIQRPRWLSNAHYGDGHPQTVVFNPDGNTMVIADFSGAVAIWDIADRNHPFAKSRLPVDSENGITQIVFGPDGRTLVTAGDDVLVWDLADRSRPSLVSRLGFRAFSVAFHPQKMVLVVGDEHSLNLWDLAEVARPQWMSRLDGVTGRPETIKFSGDGEVLFATQQEDNTGLWNTANVHKVEWVGSVGTSAVGQMAITPDGRIVLTDGEDGTAVFWSATAVHGAPRPIDQLTGPFAESIVDGLLAINPGLDGRSLVAIYRSGLAEFWDLSPTKPVRRATVRIHVGGTESVAFTRDRRLVVTGGGDGTVEIWSIADPMNPVRMATVKEHFDDLGALALSPDGRLMAIGGPSSSVPLWDLINPRHPVRVGEIAGVGRANRLLFGPHGRTLAISGSDPSSRVSLWDLTTPARPVRRASMANHAHIVTSLAFSSDGRMLITAGMDRVVMLWDVHDLARPTRFATIPGLSTEIGAVSISPDGRTLAVSAYFRPVVFWDVSVRSNPVRLVAGTRGQMETGAMAFSQDGRTFFTEGSDTRTGMTVELWDLKDMTDIRDNAVSWACGLAGRGLAREEWARYVPEVEFRSTCNG